MTKTNNRGDNKAAILHPFASQSLSYLYLCVESLAVRLQISHELFLEDPGTSAKPSRSPGEHTVQCLHHRRHIAQSQHINATVWFLFEKKKHFFRAGKCNFSQWGLYLHTDCLVCYTWLWNWP